ncbi:hypothetical protein AVEN_273271-1 [Araneus ventricosus]|uniref:Uncharacterized protein n=1 Tax=Araneus ventricosus TaxID=182803 RepID=A0A4Y2I1R1_ARAVE|nr:hypothetical protein AVEN_273271-1 [Araneus ventricosus]
MFSCFGTGVNPKESNRENKGNGKKLIEIGCSHHAVVVDKGSIGVDSNDKAMYQRVACSRPSHHFKIGWSHHVVVVGKGCVGVDLNDKLMSAEQ